MTEPFQIKIDLIRKSAFAHGWSLQELAKRAKLSSATVYCILTNKYQPRPGTLKKLADCLGLAIEELVQ